MPEKAPDGIEYQATNELFHVSKKAKAERFTMTLGAAICGSSTIDLGKTPPAAKSGD
jgi:hypothetical protein